MAWATTTSVISGALQPSSGLDAVAVAATYHVAIAAGASGSVLTARSLDRGGAWEPQVIVPMAWAFIDLLHDGATGNMEIVSDNPSLLGRWPRPV